MASAAADYAAQPVQRPLSTFTEGCMESIKERVQGTSFGRVYAVAAFGGAIASVIEAVGRVAFAILSSPAYVVANIIHALEKRIDAHASTSAEPWIRSLGQNVSLAGRSFKMIGILVCDIFNTAIYGLRKVPKTADEAYQILQAAGEKARETTAECQAAYAQLEAARPSTPAHAAAQNKYNAANKVAMQAQAAQALAHADFLRLQAKESRGAPAAAPATAYYHAGSTLSAAGGYAGGPLYAGYADGVAPGGTAVVYRT